ncbi:MAG: response regulator transcription factor [Gammaproteobacteria bacterium]
MNTPDPAARMRVVLADDNAFFLLSTCLLLSEHAWLQVVGSAPNGADCLALVAEHRPDVVVVDLAMPDMNGFEVAKHLTSLSDHPHVIILSQHEGPEYREGGRRVGASGYVSKAEVTTELVPLLRRLLDEGDEAA